ncbi:hypothetical protein FOA52_010612 [Chlamydomonas sp. UWO 241]|nr:hypothetical protein FOA52_010612 [Chlamydomonas sp. UWO 241]
MGRAEKPHGPMKDPVVTAMAERLGRNPAQLLLRWAVQRGTSVLAKSTSPKHLGSNLDVLSWSLSDDDFAALGALETQMRMVNGNYLLQPDGPYATLEELWDEPQEGA